MDDITRAK
jgi:hypothetical protein